ncbi:MAG: ATP-binding cassette domain-containing protein [Alphaproteobacteria bacterium]|nr:MAG: ATP-binding cassette domain-containing protein [Alphaproteobacteria bacterium]
MVAQALEALGIAALAPLPVRLLSEGQARRVALARVIASHATLWLLDEPNTALDEDARQRLARLVNDHLASGGAVIAATHSPLKFFGAVTIRLGAAGKPSPPVAANTANP